MKKIMNNWLIVVLLMGTLLGCLSACDNGGNESNATEEGTTTEAVVGESTVGETSDDREPQDETVAETETVGGEDDPSETTGSEAETEAPDVHVDYATSVKLDMNSDTLKQEVTVKTFIDGDTTHFHVPTSLMDTGVIKVRYLAINTPESTGKIEEWGKAASTFTKEALSKATSIIIESDDANLNADSTGDRYLFWVWYKTADSEEYRNLNIEILQNGLAIASNSAQNRYGSTCMAAINQAKAEKLSVHSGKQDPDFYYGEAQVITLKELRCNIEEYNGIKVAFTGVITMNCDNAVYVESYDEETGVWYGMYVYYGFGLNGAGLEILAVGNESRIVGTVQYYEAGGTYQVSGLVYRVMKPDDPSNIKKLSDGHKPVYLPTTADRFVNGKVDVSFVDEEENQTVKTYDYAALAIYSSIKMEGLKVKHVSTTTNEDSSNYGAMTLTCEADGVTVKVRTTVFYDENGDMITADHYEGKTIDVQGMIEYFMGDHQIKVFTPDDIIIH